MRTCSVLSRCEACDPSAYFWKGLLDDYLSELFVLPPAPVPNTAGLSRLARVSLLRQSAASINGSPCLRQSLFSLSFTTGVLHHITVCGTGQLMCSAKMRYIFQTTMSERYNT